MDYEKLKQIIQQANPEIMELKFGCWVNYEVFPMRAIRNGVVSQNLDNSVCVLHDGLIPDYIIIKRDIKEILGRPIRLADVLLATNSLPFNPKFKALELISDDFRNTVGWNLKDDNLDNQSDETKQFLIELLVK